MDALKDILNKIPYSLVLVVYLLFLSYDYYSFTHAEDSPLLMKQAEIEATEVQANEIRKKIKEAKEFEAVLNTKREELRALAGELGSMKASLTESFDIPELIKIITAEANRVGLTVVALRPGEEVKQEFYAEKKFDLQFSGVYVQLLVFLDRLSGLQKIIRVSGLRVAPTGPQNAKYVDLKGNVELLAYRYEGSKADEIAAGTSAAAGTGQ